MTGIGPERAWGADGLWKGARRTFRSPSDLELAIRIGRFLVTMPRQLDRRPLDVVLRNIEAARTSGHAGSDPDRITRLRQAWLASPLFRSRNTCYVRAVTMYRFLDATGRVLRIHFGVEPGVSAADRLRGHAWVTLDDELLEAPDPVLAGRVRELYVYPP